MHALTMACAVTVLPWLSARSASASHCSRESSAPFFLSADTPLAMMASTWPTLPSCSWRRPAAIQISCDVGIVLRALLRTWRARSGVSRRASASHSSCECGMTSTARARRIRASSGLSSSLTVSFHSLTDAGMYSRAARRGREGEEEGGESVQVERRVRRRRGRAGGSGRTFAQDPLLGLDVRLELDGAHPDPHRLRQLLDRVGEDDLGVLGRLRASTTKRPTVSLTHRCTSSTKAQRERASGRRTLSSLAQSHTSSFLGHWSQPSAMILRAATCLPATFSSHAAATHPGACLGFVLVSDWRSARARLMSLRENEEGRASARGPQRRPRAPCCVADGERKTRGRAPTHPISLLVLSIWLSSPVK